MELKFRGVSYKNIDTFGFGRGARCIVHFRVPMVSKFGHGGVLKKYVP